MADNNYRQLRTSRANDVLGTIRNCFAYIGKHYRLAFIAAIIFIILSSLTGVVSSYLFTPIINNYIVPYIGQENPDLSGFVRMLGVMIAVYASGLLSSFAFSSSCSSVMVLAASRASCTLSAEAVTARESAMASASTRDKIFFIWKSSFLISGVITCPICIYI